MTTFSSDHKQAVMTIQSGIVPWEDAVPVQDWRLKTVTLIGRSLMIIAELLRELIESRAHGMERFFRLALAPAPPISNAVQTRRLFSVLSVSPPGFSDTEVEIANDVYRVQSELEDVTKLDIEYLTQYRHCVLLGTTSIGLPVTNFPIDWSKKFEFGGEGLLSLFTADKSLLVLRVLDMESHAVLQVVGSAISCDKVSKFFEHSVRRVYDVRTISEVIRLLPA